MKKPPFNKFSPKKKQLIFRVSKESPISNVGVIAGNIALENKIKNYSITFGMSAAYTDKDGVSHLSDIEEGKCTIIIKEV